MMVVEQNKMIYRQLKSVGMTEFEKNKIINRLLTEKQLKIDEYVKSKPSCPICHKECLPEDSMLCRNMKDEYWLQHKGCL